MKRAHNHSRDGNSVKQARKEGRCTRPRQAAGGKSQDSTQHRQQQLERTSRLNQKKMDKNTHSDGCKKLQDVVETSKGASKESRPCPKILFRKHFFRFTKSLLKYLKGVKFALYRHALRIIKKYQEIHGLAEVAILQKIELSLRTLVGPNHWQTAKQMMQQCDAEMYEENEDEDEYNLLGEEIGEEISDEDSIAPVNDDETNVEESPMRESSSIGESQQSEAEESIDESVRPVRETPSDLSSIVAQNHARSISLEVPASEVSVIKHDRVLSKKVLARARSPESYIEELPDIFRVFKKQDEQYQIADYLEADYLEKLEADTPNLYFLSGDSTSTASSCTGINEVWRDKICEWSYQVVDHFDYNRQVVAIALNFLDRYLSKKAVNRKIFQLAAMTSLFTAIKLNEQRALSLNAFLNLSRGYFEAEHVLKMEHIMFRTLDWRMHPPIALVQSKHLMFCLPRHVPRRPDIMEITRFMTEISVGDYFFVSKKESTIALAAILSAFDVIGPTVVREVDRFFFVDTVRRLTGLEPCTPEVYACMDRLKKSFQDSDFSLSIFDKEKGSLVTRSP